MEIERLRSRAEESIYLAALAARLNSLTKKHSSRSKGPKNIPQGQKPDIDSIGIVPGMNPRSTARMSFSASREVVP
jgi:hypothetical protein